MRIELFHDLLAKKIYEKASQDDRDQARARNIVAFKFNLNQKTPDMYLSEKELALITPYIAKLDLSQQQLDFIQVSKDRIKWHYRKKYLAYSAIAITGLFFAFMKIFEKEHRARLDTELLAQNSIKEIYNLTQHINNLKSVADLRTLKVLSETLQNNTLQNPNALTVLIQTGADTSQISPARDTGDYILATQLSTVTISGQVKNGKNKPLPNCQLQMGDMSLLTDQNGRYTFFILTDTSLLPQEMLLTATHPNWGTGQQSVLPRQAVNQTFDFILKSKTE